MSCSLTTAASAVSKPASSPSTASATCGFGSASASGQDATVDRLCSPWSASTWLMRSRAPSLHSAMTTRLPAACSDCTCLVTASNTPAAFSVRSAAKLWPARAPTSIDGAALLRHRERRQPRQRRGLQPLGPFGFGQIEPVRRQRLVGRAAVARERLLARLVVVLDLRQPLARGVLGQRLQDHRRARHVVEQRVEPVVEQRQPVLHAGMAAALAHRLVQQVLGIGGAERRDIAGAEFADRVGGELELGDRHEIERAHLHHGALGLRIEAADASPACRRRNRAAPAGPCRAANRSRMPPRTA